MPLRLHARDAVQGLDKEDQLLDSVYKALGENDDADAKQEFHATWDELHKSCEAINSKDDCCPCYPHHDFAIRMGGYNQQMKRKQKNASFLLMST